jgi:hypothetical protein
MRRSRLFLNLILLFIFSESFPQNFSITAPKADFDGHKLTVTYDLKNSNQADIFFMWVEVKKKDGSIIRANSFKGDVGDSISPGKDKVIIWIPEDDAVFLDEDVTIEIKSEKYVKSFNKGSMILASIALPGLGQTKISKGKPFWLMGVVSYGTLAGGMIIHSSYNKTLDAYTAETEPVERADLWDKSQQQKKISGTLFVTAGAIWIGNLIWVAATPNKYKPLQHSKFTLNVTPYEQRRITMLSFKYTF